VVRLGVLTPSSNTVLEPVTARLTAPLADRLSVHVARFPVTRIDDDRGSHRQFSLQAMLEAVRLLADARVDAYLWSGTAAAWEGVATDEALVEAIRVETGKPATTSTLALLAAFRALGVRRYGLVVPYVAAIAAAIERNFAAAGFACTASERDDLTTNWDFACVSPESLASKLRRLAHGGPDALAIVCTNVRGAEVAVSMERELGIPVLDSVVVGLWGALQLLSIETPTTGFGRLATLADGSELLAHA
jgi:maleate isomerase